MKLLHSLLALFVVALWGLNFVPVKVALTEIPPFSLCCLRFLLIGVPGILFFKRPEVPFKWVALYSFVMFVLHVTLVFLGIKLGVPGGLSALILQTQVFFSIFFAFLFLKEKVNRWQLLGGILSLTGLCVIGSHVDIHTPLTGLFLVLNAAAVWGLGTIIVKKMGKTNSGSLLVWSSFLAWPPLLVLSFIFESPASLQWASFSPAIYSSIFFMVMMSTVVCFGIWNWLLQIYPVSLITPFTLLVPFFAMLASALFLNESLDTWKIVAGTLIVSGLCLNFLSSRLLVKTENS